MKRSWNNEEMNGDWRMNLCSHVTNHFQCSQSCDLHLSSIQHLAISNSGNNRHICLLVFSIFRAQKWRKFQGAERVFFHEDHEVVEEEEWGNMATIIYDHQSIEFRSSICKMSHCSTRKKQFPFKPSNNKWPQSLSICQKHAFHNWTN